MSSLTGLSSGYFTDIDVVDTISLDGTAGATNQVITSDGFKSEWASVPSTIPVADLLTAGNGIDITATGNPETISVDNDATLSNTGGTGDQLAVLKVPNALTAGSNVSFSSGSTYDGSAAITVATTDTLYQAGDGIIIDTTTSPGYNLITADLKSGSGLTITSEEIDLASIPNSALANSTISGISLGSNLSNLAAGTDIQFVSGSGPAATYNGSEYITINSTASDTTYAGGDNISINTSPNPDEIDLDASITGMTGIAYTGSGTTLSGGGGGGDETTTTYLDLTSATNAFPPLYPQFVEPYLGAVYYDPAVAVNQSLTTSHVELFSGALTTTFVSYGTNAEVEVKILNGGGSSNRWIYLGLLGGGVGGTTEWSISSDTGGGSGTGSRATNRIVHYKDETDYDYVVMTWVLSGLSYGATYIINPSAKTSATTNYIYAGGSYPLAMCRVLQI